MSKETSPDQVPCHYEWSFNKSRHLGILPTNSTSNLPIIPNNVTFKSSNKNGSSQLHIPYSGPTLWNPRYHQRSPDKFLTLTPLKPNQNTVGSSLPVISITPRRGSREFSFFGGNDIRHNNDNNSHPTTNFENHHQYNQDPDAQLQNLSTDEIMDSLNFLSIHRKKKKEQISIFPDVYALVRSPRRVGNTSKSFKHEKTTNHRKDRNFNANCQTSASTQQLDSVLSQFSRSKLPVIPGINSNSNSSKLDPNIPLFDKNIQDYGTLYSRQQDALYSRITREPTVIQPTPSIGYRYVFPKSDNLQMNSVGPDEGDECKNMFKTKKNESLKTQYYRNRVKDRRSYIRWNVHRGKSKSVNLSNANDIGQQETSHNVGTSGKEAKLRAISEKLQALQRKNERKNLDTSSSTKRRIAEHFCDVLGQKTCQRCQEFYVKNFQIPPKESMEKVRSVSSPVTRENTLTLPTVGLQKVVIRIKDESGRMEIANEEINKELL